MHGYPRSTSKVYVGWAGFICPPFGQHLTYPAKCGHTVATAHVSGSGIVVLHWPGSNVVQGGGVQAQMTCPISDQRPVGMRQILSTLQQAAQVSAHHSWKSAEGEMEMIQEIQTGAIYKDKILVNTKTVYGDCWRTSLGKIPQMPWVSVRLHLASSMAQSAPTLTKDGKKKGTGGKWMTIATGSRGPWLHGKNMANKLHYITKSIH